MSGTVSPERIAALVEAARSGQLPDAEAPAGPRHRQRLRPVDFSRPTKFTTDHQRRITRAVETFCQTAGSRLSAELRCAIELETLNADQLTWSAAQTALPSGAVSMTVELEPLETQMQLVAELPFLLTGIELLLGGPADRPPVERRLSEIDWALGRRLLGSVITQLVAPWQELTGANLRPGSLDFASDGGRGVAMSEPTFVIELECRVNRQSTALSLLIPWVAIEAVGDRIAGREDDQTARHAPEMEALGAALAGVPVAVRAEVAATELALADILALAPGSLIRLGARAEDGVTVFAENTRLGRAKPGSNGPRRAFQLIDREDRHDER